MKIGETGFTAMTAVALAAVAMLAVATRKYRQAQTWSRAGR